MQENGSYKGRGHLLKGLVLSRTYGIQKAGTSVEEFELIEMKPITKTCPHS